MHPLRAALLAGLMPGIIALAGLALGALLASRRRRGGEPASVAPGEPSGRPPGTPVAAGLAPSIAAGAAVVLSFFLIQEQLKPGSTGLWPPVAINRAATLSIVSALVAIVAGLWPRSRWAVPAAIALAGAIFAWGLGGPVSRSAGQLAGWIAAAAAWGAVIGGLWHAAVLRRLAERGSAAMLVASALVPIAAAPVFIFGGGSLLPQPAMSLVAVAGAAVAAALVVGGPRIAPLAGGTPALLASGSLLLACAMWTNYRPSAAALGLLMAAPLGLLPAALWLPKPLLARWAVAITPVALIAAAAVIVAWQMAPSDDGYGY